MRRKPVRRAAYLLFRSAALRGNPIQSTLVVDLLSNSQQPGAELAISGLLGKPAIYGR